MNRSVSLHLFTGLRKKKEIATIALRCREDAPRIIQFSARRLTVAGHPLLTLLLSPSQEVSYPSYEDCPWWATASD